MSKIELSPRTKETIAEIVAAIRKATPNRELVKQGFAEHLSALKLPQREIIFHPNLIDACKTIWTYCKAAIDKEWGAARGAARDAAWDAAWDAARDAAWDAAWGAARGAAWGAAWGANPFLPFIKLLRGGCFAFWITEQYIHVVLASVHSANQRLHRGDGPAVEFEDGSGVWAWKGVRVPKEVITDIRSYSPQTILAEANAEIRRVMIERYGQDKFFLDAGAKVIHKNGESELLSIDLPGDPDKRMKAVKVRCPSTSAVYVLRVPPNQKKVQEAIAWTFGMTAEEYAEHLVEES